MVAAHTSGGLLPPRMDPGAQQGLRTSPKATSSGEGARAFGLTRGKGPAVSGSASSKQYETTDKFVISKAKLRRTLARSQHKAMLRTRRLV